MLPDYTFALGQTDAIKKIFNFLESQKSVAKNITQQKENKEKYAI